MGERSGEKKTNEFCRRDTGEECVQSSSSLREILFPKSFRNGGECCPRLETASWKSNGASFSNNLIHCYSTILLIFPLLPPSLVSFTQNETKTRHVLYLKKKRNKNSRYFLYTLFISQKNKLQSFNKILKQISFRVNFNQLLSVNLFYILSERFYMYSKRSLRV